MNDVEKTKKCALEILEKLHYDVDETEPIIEGSTSCLEQVHFSVLLNPTLRKFELKNPLQIKDLKIERRLNVLNRRLEVCVKRDKS
jgi:hypothetical protein